MNALPILADRDRRRVVAAAALMTSDKDGEVLAAVRATCRILAPHGVGPADLIAAALTAGSVEASRRRETPDPYGAGAQARSTPPPRYDLSAKHQRLARMCLMQGIYLNDWEREFLNSIVGERSLTPRQQQKLNGIAAKIEAKMKERSNDRDF